MGFRVYPDFRKTDRNHGPRLALVSCDVNLVSWRLHATKHNKEIQRLESSYDTDDSEYNFIPCHVNIDDIEVKDDENFSLGIEQAEPDPERMS